MPQAETLHDHHRRLHGENVTVFAHLGPTNSGKTHDALIDAARCEGRAVIAMPLRLLAIEAFEKLAAELGDEVGLRTGEEVIRPDARIVCCTVEMAPDHGELLVLDEVHWAADRSRGDAWTRLLLSSGFQRKRLLGAPDALPMLRECEPDLELVCHQRLGDLQWVGAVRPDRASSLTAVVTFSRRDALARFQALAQRGSERVGILYGKMPLGARRAVIDAARAGSYDVLVCTDVIGHGINLPIGQVLFAQTTKWDGTTLRPLERWEAAQVAGRAGRHGLADQGHVGVLAGCRTDPKVPRRALTASVDVGEGLRGFRLVTHAVLGPQPEDFADVRAASQLRAALTAWEHDRRRDLKFHEWLTVRPVDDLRARLDVVHPAARDRLDLLSVRDVFQLSRSPLDPQLPSDRDLLADITAVVCGLAPASTLRERLAEPCGLTEAEHAAHHAACVRWAALTFAATCGDLLDVAQAAEKTAAQVVLDELGLSVRASDLTATG